MADPRNTDPADQDPRDRGLSRRSNAPSVGPWLVVGLILVLGAAAYVLSAVAS